MTTINAERQTTCPDWCTTNHALDPDGGYDGPAWPAVPSLRGETGASSVRISACQAESGAMVVYSRRMTCR